jgi:hypothetical protein
MLRTNDKNKSLDKLSLKFEAIKKQLESTSKQDRIKSLKTLRAVLTMLSNEEQLYFADYQYQEECSSIPGSN